MIYELLPTHQWTLALNMQFSATTAHVTFSVT